MRKGRGGEQARAGVGANKRAGKRARGRSTKRATAAVRESAEQKQGRAKEVVKRLRREYPDAKCSLTHRNPFELIVATILSAQCTDERVNQVTPRLFERFPAADDMAGARPEELEELIRPTGFFRNKTKSLLGMSHALSERHGGEVPATMDELVKLPGVGRKTANVVLGNAFNRNIGVVVDTHVARLSGRLGLTAETDAARIERDLMQIIPRKDWTLMPHLFIDHGRAVCKAPTPKCEICVLNDICPSAR